jgi:hypothetical protein
MTAPTMLSEISPIIPVPITTIQSTNFEFGITEPNYYPHEEGAAHTEANSKHLASPAHCSPSVINSTRIHRMPSTTTNMAGIGDSLKQVAGSIAPRRAQGVRNGRRAVNSVQPGVVMAHGCSQFESNASRFPPSTVGATGGGRNSAIIRRISANRFFEISTSAIWNAT